MLHSALRCAAMALIVVTCCLPERAHPQSGPETNRCLTREQLEIEPIFSACPPLVDEASVSDASFVSKLYVQYGYTSYSTRWQGPGYFQQNDYSWNAQIGAYEGPCGARLCQLYPPGWVQQEHWPFFVGTLLAEDIGTWTYSELRNGEVFQSRDFEVRGLQLSALSGDQQTGLVSDSLPQPLVLKLESFEGAGIGDEVIGWEITGPKGAKGAAVFGIGSGSETDANGLETATVHLGSKPGVYTVTLNNRRIARESWPSFSFTAIDDIGDTDPPEEHPATEEGVGGNLDQQCDSVGNPITLSIGNKYQREADLEPAGLSPIEFVRYHNSLGFLSRSFRNYWTHSYDRYVEVPADPQAEPVKVVRADGRKVNFFWNGSGFEPHPGVYSRLEQQGEGWRYTEDGLTVETFDADGLLLDISAASGMRQTVIHDADGRLVRVESSLGDGLDFGYDRSGRLEFVTHSSGRSWTYRYDELGRFTFVDRPDGTTREYHYEDLRHPYALTGITLEDGRRYASYAYDEQGRAIASWHAGDADRVDVQYEDDGSRVVVDPIGNATVYATRIENKRGFLDAISGPLCSQGCGQTDTQYEYDADGNVIRKTAYGIVTEFGAHDAMGQPGFVVRAAGTPEETRIDYRYDPAFRGRITQITEPSVLPGASRVTSREHDSAGNLVEETIEGFDPFGEHVSRTTSWSYDAPYGQLSLMDGPRTDVPDITTYEYYADSQAEGPNRARLRAIVDPNGIRIRDDIQYSETGKVLSERRPSGVTLHYAYEAGSDRIASFTRTGGELFDRTRWTYHPTGEVARVTVEDETGASIETRFSYDDARRLVVVESGSGSGGSNGFDRRVTYTLDAVGNVIAETHRSADSGQADLMIQRVFDSYGRLDRLTQGGVTEGFDYAPDGTLAATIDGNLGETRYVYDALKRLTSTERFGEITTRRAYDTQGNTMTVTNPEGHTTRYLFDDLGNRLRLDSTDSGQSTFEYDEAGAAVLQVDAAGQRSAMTYDAGGRLISIDREGMAHDVQYGYDDCSNGQGRLCRTSVGWGHVTSYAWNGLGEIATVTTAAGRLDYSHAPQGKLTAIGYPSGREVRFNRDQAGWVRQIRLATPGQGESILVDDIRYSPFGRPVGWRLANGLEVSSLLDGRHRTESIEAPGTLAWQALDYDGNDNLLGLLRDGNGYSFGYDRLDRLAGASLGDLVLAYDYDDVGNRLSRTTDGAVESASYQPGTNRLLSFGERQYTHDQNGNTTRLSIGPASALEFLYSPNNRLAAVVDSASSETLAIYRYDALGQRVEKTAGGVSRRFAYGLDGSLLAVLDGSNEILHEYVYLEGQVLVDLGPANSGAGAEPAQEVIIDTDQATVVGSNWQSKRSGAAIGGSYLQNRKRDQRGVYWYIDDVGAVGPHDIFVRWLNPDGDGSATRYGVSVLNASQTAHERSGVVVSHDQAKVGEWVLLGNFDIKPRHQNLRQYVQLLGYENQTTAAGVYLEADAVRLVPTTIPEAAANTYFIHVDHLGTPQAVTDLSAEMVWRADYLPFGKAEVDEDIDGDGSSYELNLRFPGQYYDEESGLHYNHYRYYDAQTGRYFRPDPIGLDGGLNPFVYADNNPLGNVDPLGLWVKRCSRQLGNPSGPNRSPDNPIRHDYLVVSGSILSFQMGDSWLWGQGRIDTVGEDPQRDCPMVCSDDEFDAYVFQAAESVGVPTYCLFALPGTLGHALGARNCQTWADDVLALARENYLRGVECPRCFQ